MPVKVPGGRWFSLLAALALLAITVSVAKPQAIAEKLMSLDPLWVLLGIALSVPTYLVFALRWLLVTRRLGAPLRFSSALQEYYLGTFVNQTLPTGLAGAALRAVRHARTTKENGQPVGYATAIQGVVLERISGLAALSAFALVGAAVLSREHPRVGLYGGAAVLVIALTAVLAFRVAESRSTKEASFTRAARVALVGKSAFAEQALVSCAGVVLLVLGFYCAARAGDVGLSLGRSFCVAPLILGAMVVPLAMAGWGLREAAAAALFGALGASASTGVAVSITFGVIGLVSSLPGLVVLLMPGELGRAAGRDGAGGIALDGDAGGIALDGSVVENGE